MGGVFVTPGIHKLTHSSPVNCPPPTPLPQTITISAALFFIAFPPSMHSYSHMRRSCGFSIKFLCKTSGFEADEKVMRKHRINHTTFQNFSSHFSLTELSCRIHKACAWIFLFLRRGSQGPQPLPVRLRGPAGWGCFSCRGPCVKDGRDHISKKHTQTTPHRQHHTDNTTQATHWQHTGNTLATH